jgi:hypothetical protein
LRQKKKENNKTKDKSKRFRIAKLFDVDVFVTAHKIANSGSQSSKFLGKIDINHGKMTINPLEISYLGGEFDAQITADLISKDGTVLVKGKTRGWKLGSILKEKHLGFPVSGNVSATYDLNGAGNTIPDFFNGLKVAVFHGFNVGKLNRRGEEDHFRIRGCFDLYCTHGPNTTNRFRELADKFGYFRAIETGWPAIDPLFDGSVQSSNSDKPTILLCSTFSRNLTCAPHLYNEISRLSKKGNWRWLVQFHPKMASDIVEKYKGLQNENLSFIETDNVLPLLQQADLMVSDTSSILVMFLLQQKPVVTFRNISPKPYLFNITEADKLESAIIDTLKKPAELMNAIKELIAQTHPYNDGGSSERVLQAVDTFLRENKPQNNKPLNLIRNLKARRKLAYWKV